MEKIGKPTEQDILLLRDDTNRAARSFKELYERHVQAVYLYALSIVRAPSDAEDVCQDAWMVLWKKRASVELAGHSVLPWLLVTTRYTALKKLRSTRLHSHNAVDAELIDMSSAHDPDAAMRVADLTTQVERVLDSLSPLDRGIYELCVTDGMSYADAASSIGATTGVVRNRLSRVRKTLRTRLTEPGDSL